MSDLYLAPTPASGSTPAGESSQMPRRRRSVLPLVAGAVAAAAASALVVLVVLQPEPPRDDRPVVLPETFAGLPMAEHQFAEDLGWRKLMTEDEEVGFGDHVFDGRSFAKPKQLPAVNLTVVRTDARGKGDLFSEHEPFVKIGHVWCRHPFPISRKAGTPGDRRTLTCWRASETLTVGVFVLGSPPGYEEATAKAVDQVWALQN